MSFFIQLLAYSVVLVFVLYTLRIFISIPHFLKLQQQQTLLLKEIARRQGVTEETISEIENITR